MRWNRPPGPPPCFLGKVFRRLVPPGGADCLPFGPPSAPCRPTLSRWVPVDSVPTCKCALLDSSQPLEPNLVCCAGRSEQPQHRSQCQSCHCGFHERLGVYCMGSDWQGHFDGNVWPGKCTLAKEATKETSSSFPSAFITFLPLARLRNSPARPGIVRSFQAVVLLW